MTEITIKTGMQNLAYLENILADYRRDSSCVSAEWRGYFTGAANSHAESAVTGGPSFRERSTSSPCSNSRTRYGDQPPTGREIAALNRLPLIER